MRTCTLTSRIRRSPAEVFDFMVVHQTDNHPKWEKEVVEVRREPLRAGAKGVMVRREWGKVQEAPFEVVELVPGRRAAYRSGAGGFHLHLVFDFEERDGETELTTRSTLRLSGWLRLMWPVLWFVHPARTARIVGDFARLFEGPAAQAGSGASPSTRIGAPTLVPSSTNRVAASMTAADRGSP